MQFAIHPSFAGDRGRFTVIAAPASAILPALGRALAKRERETRYLAGGDPAIFQGLIPFHHRLRLAAPETPRGLARAVADAPEPYIIIEYDPRFAPDGDAGAWLYACRERAHESGAAVLLAATSPAVLPPAVTAAADRAFLMAPAPVPPRGSQRSGRDGGRQMTLGGAGR